MASPDPDTDALARARRELEALAAATRALGAASDVGPALGRIAAAALELAGADLAYVTAHDPGSGVPRVLARADSEAAVAARTRAGAALRRRARSASPWSSRKRSWASSSSPGRAGGRPASSTWRRSAGWPASPRSPSGTGASPRRWRAGGTRPASAAEDLVRVAGQLRRIVDAAKDGILTTDGGGLITSANPAAEALFGHPAGALFGRPVAVVLPGLAARGHRRGTERRQAPRSRASARTARGSPPSCRSAPWPPTPAARSS